MNYCAHGRKRGVLTAGTPARSVGLDRDTRRDTGLARTLVSSAPAIVEASGLRRSKKGACVPPAERSTPFTITLT